MERIPESKLLTAQGPDGHIVIDTEVMKKPGACMTYRGKTGIVRWTTSTVTEGGVTIYEDLYDGTGKPPKSFVDVDANNSHLSRALEYFAGRAHEVGSISTLVVEQRTAINSLRTHVRNLLIALVGITAVGTAAVEGLRRRTEDLKNRIEELEEAALPDTSDRAPQVEPSETISPAADQGSIDFKPAASSEPRLPTMNRNEPHIPAVFGQDYR